MTGLNLWVSVFSVGVVCTFYTSLVFIMNTTPNSNILTTSLFLGRHARSDVDRRLPGDDDDRWYLRDFGQGEFVGGRHRRGLEDCQGGWQDRVFQVRVVSHTMSFSCYFFISSLYSFDPDPRVRYTMWTTVVGGFFQWLVIYVGNQSNIQRALACPTLRNAQM